MNRKAILRWIVAGSAGILFLFLLFLVQPPSDKHAARNQVDGTSSETAGGSVTPSLVPTRSWDDAIGSRFVAILEGSRPDYTKQQVEAFVQDRSHDLVSLIAAYSLLQHDSDPDAFIYLLEALERFPNEGVVVAAALIEAFHGNLDADTDDLMAAFIRLEPDNSLPMILMASESLKNGRLKDGLAEIGNMLGHQLETFDPILSNARMEFFKSINWSDPEAALIAARKFGTLPMIVNDLADIRTDLLGSLADAQSSEDREAIIAAGVIAGQQLRDGDSLLLTLWQVRQEMQFFRKLGGETQSEYFGGELTGDELLMRAQNEYDEIRDLNSKTRILLSSIRNPSVAHEFGALLINEGEIAAYRWLAEEVAEGVD